MADRNALMQYYMPEGSDPTYGQQFMPSAALSAYQPTWRDRLASMLMPDQAASPERNRLVEGLTGSRGIGNSSLGLVDFVPGVGQAFQAQEEARKGEGANMMMAIFAGPAAKTANLKALTQAETLAKQGAPREQIYADTGWFKGVDGKWRFEIDDRGSAVFSGPLEMTGKSENGAPFRDRMMHTNYLNAYPDAENLTVQRMSGKQHSQFANKGGYFDGQGFWMDGAQPDGGRGIALHELQHDAQSREGFSRGGNMRMFRPDEIAAEQARIRSLPEGDGWTSISNASGDDPVTAGNNLYRRLAGEVEARAVQKRMDMTADQRRARPPWQDYDVPEDQQIVRFGDIIDIVKKYGIAAAANMYGMDQVSMALSDQSQPNALMQGF